MPPAKDTLTPPADKWKREQFIEEVIEVLDRHGGRAEKDVVIAEVYRRGRAGGTRSSGPATTPRTGASSSRRRSQVAASGS